VIVGRRKDLRIRKIQSADESAAQSQRDMRTSSDEVTFLRVKNRIRLPRFSTVTMRR
jgi:hypothetical protein